MDDGFSKRYLELTDIIESWLPVDFRWENARVLDFGCGEALTALGFAVRKRCKSVVGVDIMPDVWRCLARAKDNIPIQALPDNLQLYQVTPGSLHSNPEAFDLIYSWSTFEHVDQRLLACTTSLLASQLAPKGYMFIQIAPLYYSAEGGHLKHKVPEPWAHLRWQDSLLRDQLRAACETPAEFAELTSMYSTLNRLTAKQLKELVSNADLQVIREYTTKCSVTPPPELLDIFGREVLETEQIVLLMRKSF